MANTGEVVWKPCQPNAISWRWFKVFGIEPKSRENLPSTTAIDDPSWSRCHHANFGSTETSIHDSREIGLSTGHILSVVDWSIVAMSVAGGRE